MKPKVALLFVAAILVSLTGGFAVGHVAFPTEQTKVRTVTHEVVPQVCYEAVLAWGASRDATLEYVGTLFEHRMRNDWWLDPEIWLPLESDMLDRMTDMDAATDECDAA